jgi:hypothetical protein
MSQQTRIDMRSDRRSADSQGLALRAPSGSAVFYFFAACVSLLFAYTYFQMTANPDAELAALAHGEGVRPFQYRVLVPFIAGVIETATHVKLHRIYALLTIVATFSALVAFRRYLRLFLPENFSSLFALLLIYPIFWNYAVLSGNYNPADIPAVLFFTLGLTAIYRRQLALFYVIFLVSTFNRETSCFLTFAFIFYNLKDGPVVKTLLHAAAQLAIWLAIKALLANIFSANPGYPIFQNAIPNNIEFFGKLLRLHPPSVFKIFVFGFIWTLIPFGWRRLPLFLRRTLWVCVPFLAGMSIVGVLSEVRIYSELIPILLAPALYTVYRLYFEPEVSGQ